MGTVWSRLSASARAELVTHNFGFTTAGGGAFVSTTTVQPDFEPGLQARIADPLWMLTRQWQLGEFRGEDAGSPVRVTAEVASTKPTLYLGGGSHPRALPATGVLLEPHVEAEALADGPGAFGRNAEAGLHFFRLLDSQGVGTLRPGFRKKYALKMGSISTPVDAETVHKMGILVRRSFDAQAFAKAAATGLAAALPPGVTAAQLPKVTTAYTTWSAWLKTRFLEPPPSGDTWKPSRMEHNFGIAAAGATGAVELTAKGYPGGHLDWHSFDMVPESNVAIANAPLTVTTVQVLPSSVRYEGMPARRWWSFEEGTVQFGGIAAGPTDPARMLVAEFATVFGDDWYLIPIPLTANTLARVRSVAVTDTFGIVDMLKSFAEVDGPDRKWRFFELTGDDSVEREMAPCVYLAPAVVGGVEADPVERVTLARDEGANLAWAIERLVEDPLGRPIDRTHVARRTAPAPEAGTGWRYRAESPTPPNWIPLVPKVTAEGAQYRLRRGVMEQWGDDAGAKGALLEPRRPLEIFEEEVPSEGVVVTRAWQLARNSDGSLLVWLGRRKKAGKGEARSGLRYDQILGTGGER